MKTTKKTLLPIFSLMFLDQTCLSILFPVLTLVLFDQHSHFFPVGTSLKVRSMWYGICIAVPHVINVFMTPVLATLSDYWGRKKLFILATLGTFCVAVVGGISIFSGWLGLFVFSCALQGVFSRADPIAIAAVGDVVQAEDKVVWMGFLQTVISLGAFFGPILGGYCAGFFLADLHFSFPFWVAGGFAFAACWVAMGLVRETNRLRGEGLPLIRRFAPPSPARGEGIKKENGTLLIDGERTSGEENGIFSTDGMVGRIGFLSGQILPITIILLLSQFSWRLYYLYIPPILKTEFHFTAQQLGWFVGLIAFWLMLATTFGIKLLKKYFALEKMLFIALYTIFIGLSLTVLFCLYQQAIGFIWFAAIPIAMGDVIAFSCIVTLYSNIAGAAQQGRVMGVCFIVVAIVWAGTGLLGSYLMSLNPLLPLIATPFGILPAITLMHRRALGAFTRDLTATN